MKPPYLKGPPPLNDSDQHDDNGNDQQDMNKITHRIAGHQPQQPQNYQYHSNRPQHLIPLSDCAFPLPAIASPYQPAVIIRSLWSWTRTTQWSSGSLHSSHRLRHWRAWRPGLIRLRCWPCHTLILIHVILFPTYGLGFCNSRSMTISTRRLLARPSGEALLAIGLPSPFPRAWMRSAGYPLCTR